MCRSSGRSFQNDVPDLDTGADKGLTRFLGDNNSLWNNMLLSSVHCDRWIKRGEHELAKLIEDFVPQVPLDDHSTTSNFPAPWNYGTPPQKRPSFLKTFGTTIVALNLYM
jgi:hypothetical protein